MNKKHIAMVSAGVIAFGATAWIGSNADDDTKDLSSFNETTTSDVDTDIEETTIVTTSRTYASQKEKFELDETFEYHDISFPVYSKWSDIDDTVFVGFEGFECPKSHCFLTLEFDSYDDSSICESMLEHHNDTYHEISKSNPQVVTINDVDISAYNWKNSGSGYEKIYIFSYNSCVYKIDFYCGDDDYENCSMFQNADDIVYSIVFNNPQTTEIQTELSTDTENQVTTQVTEDHTDPPTEAQTKSRTVYVTPTGKKYHYDSSCNGGSYSPTTLDDAESMGLTRCKKCT